MGLGSLDFLSLSEARKLAVDNKRLVIGGKDPIEERKQYQLQKQVEKARNLIFTEVAEACITSKSHECKKASNPEAHYQTTGTS